MESSVPAYTLKNAWYWWDEVNNSTLWQDRIFQTLSVLFGLVSAFALIQLVRIECRVPEYGSTTQKVFHVLNFLVNGVQADVFAFRRSVQQLKPEIIQHILLDLPGLAFFTTYALLIALWLLIWWKPIQPFIFLSKIFFAGVSLFAALVFLLYGGRLFLMLQCFPIESKGRHKKLQEVGYVTTICYSCFMVRCIMMSFNALDKAADLDVLNHPILNLLYYLWTLSERVKGFIHTKEVATKARNHTVSPHSLILGLHANFIWLNFIARTSYAFGS